MITKQFEGIRVGDEVEFFYDGITYKGYIAVIDVVDAEFPYLLRLKGFEGHDSNYQWDEPWYPEREKKKQENCIWRTKDLFRVIKKVKRKIITLKLLTLIRNEAKARGISPKYIKIVK